MKRQEWFLVFLPLVLVWYIDRITKNWAYDFVGLKSFGILNFALHRNQGAMLGLFSDLPAFLRIVSLSTGGAFLVVTFGLIQYLLPIKSLTLRSGLSVVLGGILGNVTDRIIWGYVVDFIFFMKEGSFTTPVFNIADLMQWVGYGMVFYAIAKEGTSIWPEHNSRRKQWINPQFQLKYCFTLLGVGFSISLICAVFSYTYLRVTLLEIVGPNPQVLQRFLVPFAITFGIVTTAFSVGLFTVGKIFSHKVAGPIYAFEKYIQDVFDVKDALARTPEPGVEAPPGLTMRKFKLRGKDEFKELEPLAKSIRMRVVPEVPDSNVEAPADTEFEAQADLAAAAENTGTGAGQV
jgi:signal peptidase II